METLIASLVTLALLTLLQAVLGFDNLLYISLESKRAPKEKRKAVRIWGIGIAIFLRIALLFILVKMVGSFQVPFWEVGEQPGVDHITAGHDEVHTVSAELAAEKPEVDSHDHASNENENSKAEGDSAHAEEASGDWLYIRLNLHALIVLIGGAFIIYTATKEVLHMMRLDDEHGEDSKSKSTGSVIFWIVTMNVVFSFDSILSAMALAQSKVPIEGQPGKFDIIYNMPVMVIAIVISGVLMIVLADRVSSFLEKNRMYEVLGLFILFVVGIMLVTEGAHLAHLSFFGNPIHSMSKTTFYFVIAVLVLTDIVQTRYQKNLLAKAQRAKEAAATHA